MDPNAEAFYPDIGTASPSNSSNSQRAVAGDGPLLEPPSPEVRHRPLGSRPFKTISPTLMKSQPWGAADGADAAGAGRPFGSGECTTDEQKYRRFQEIKDEIRKRARQIDASNTRAQSVHRASVPADLPPLTRVERVALFLNSLELHALVAAAFLGAVYFVGLGVGIQAAAVVHAALLAFWVGVWLHAQGPSGTRRLVDYAEVSRNVEVAPLASLVFYLCFAHFHRWQWYDVGIALVIVASPPFLQWTAHSLGKAAAAQQHPQGVVAAGGSKRQLTGPAAVEEMDLVEVEAALRRLRVQNNQRARRRCVSSLLFVVVVVVVVSSLCFWQDFLAGVCPDCVGRCALGRPGEIDGVVACDNGWCCLLARVRACACVHVVPCVRARAIMCCCGRGPATIAIKKRRDDPPVRAPAAAATGGADVEYKKMN